MINSVQTASRWVSLETQGIIVESDCVNILFWQLLDTKERFGRVLQCDESACRAPL